MIKSTQLNTTSAVNVPERVFTASTTGEPISGPVTGERQAITTMIVCNTSAVTLSDETSGEATINIYLVKSGDTADVDNIIVSNLTIPAGETVFFSDEKIILDASDQVWVGCSDTGVITVTVSSMPV
jgi:hypothetical protein